MNVDTRQLKHLQSLAWEDVFALWRENEATNPKWIEHYRRCGFTTWGEWRGEYVTAFGLERRAWHLYEITYPLRSIPRFRGGPFTSWQDHYYAGKLQPTFAELVKHPELKRHEGITALRQKFPAQTKLIGLLQGDDIIIIEGMHRCCAITLTAKWQLPFSSNVTIALADATGDTLPFMGHLK